MPLTKGESYYFVTGDTKSQLEGLLNSQTVDDETKAIISAFTSGLQYSVKGVYYCTEPGAGFDAASLMMAMEMNDIDAYYLHWGEYNWSTQGVAGLDF